MSDRARSPWPLVVVALGLGAIIAALYVFRSVRQLPVDVLDKTRELAHDLRGVAEGFRTGKVTYAFASEASELNGSARLQLATLRQVEVFQRRDEASLFWGALELPDVVVAARAPVEYVYFADLRKPWTFHLEGHDLLVRAPALEFNQPAVDVSALRYEVQAGSVLRDEALALEHLKQGLTDLARTRAQRNVALARETARREAEHFVETWLLRSFTDARDYRIRVVFGGEPVPSASPTLLPLPTQGPAQ
jgi:hypothetical protein